MADVLPFGKTEEKPPLVTPDSGIVGASGEKVKTTRSVQNEIIQRRNFVLLDCGTLEMVVSNGNAVQAYAAIQAVMPNLLFDTIQQIAGNVAVDVVKKIANDTGTGEKPAEVVTETSPE